MKYNSRGYIEETIQKALNKIKKIIFKKNSFQKVWNTDFNFPVFLINKFKKTLNMNEALTLAKNKNTYL